MWRIPSGCIVYTAGVLLIVGQVVWAGSVPGISFPLVENGQAVASVVVAGDNPVLQAAVADLTTYVQRISGAALEVHTGTADLPGPTLHLGETEYFAGTAEARQAVRLDGFLIARAGREDLIIAGNLPQGTANGIWSVLQAQFGVRWYYAGPLWEIVPKNGSLAVRCRPDAVSGAYVENPSFVGRHLWGDPPSPEFGRRMRLTQKGVPMPYVGTGHALDRVVPADKYAQGHPDYFPLIDGRRVTTGEPNPCFTHPDMLDVFMAYVREGGGGFGVNDNLTACRCERCLAVDGGSRPYMGMWNVSESYFQLLAKVAAQTAKESPRRRLGAFAYQLTNSPPKTVADVGRNVDIVLCQDTSQYFDADYRRIDQEMSAEWVRKAGGVSFYDYVGIDYWTPRYFPRILADQLRHLARIGVLGYGTHIPTMPDSSMPMFYLLHQMLWNARLDADQVIDAMLADLYGEAVGPVRAFYAHWEECWRRQPKGRWFFGMDNFRAEMEIYSLADIERGWTLLEEAAALAKDSKVRERIAWLQRYFAFTRAAARAHDASMKAIRSSPGSVDEARRLSDAVVETWAEFARQLEAGEKLPGSAVSGWHPKCMRVRAWGLKQQMRDGALAPLVRRAVASEGRVEPAELRRNERALAELAVANRQKVETLVTESIGAAIRLPRADGLRVADVLMSARSPALNAGPGDWPGLPRVEALPWVFRLRPADDKVGKYDEPMPQHIVDPPTTEDQSVTWQATWDDRRLYLRIAVRDDRHVQDRPPAEMWRQDSVQIALNPDRGNFEYPLASWDYMWGGYRGPEAEFGISLRDGKMQMHVWRAPPLPPGTDAGALITAAAARDGSVTVYDVAVEWRLMPGSAPQAERSLGIALVVNDVDDGTRRSAEYGGGVVHAKRPSEFAALRLVERIPEKPE